MNPEFSSYYPPRAQDRWLGRILGQRLDRLRIWLRLRFSRSFLATPLVLSFNAPELLLCLLIPGEPYRRLGQRTLGRVFLIIWWAWALVLLIFLGSPTLNGFAVSGMISCHASGLGFLYLRDRETSRGYPAGLRVKILAQLVAWLFCAGLLYWPGYRFFENTVARPMFIPGENSSVVFDPHAARADVARGDLVAFKNESFRLDRGARLAGGLMLGRVIGLPGDRVEFGPHRIRVNGHDAERLPTMPTEGELVAAPGEWLVWPTVKLPGYEGSDSGAMAETYLRLANVPQQNFVGRAFRRWFFQRQDQP